MKMKRDPFNIKLESTSTSILIISFFLLFGRKSILDAKQKSLSIHSKSYSYTFFFFFWNISNTILITVTWYYVILEFQQRECPCSICNLINSCKICNRSCSSDKDVFLLYIRFGFESPSKTSFIYKSYFRN